MVDSTKSAPARNVSPSGSTRTKFALRSIGKSPTDDSIYIDLMAATERVRSTVPSGSYEAMRELESLLFAEARLLDSRRYRDWLELFTKDSIYWVPSNPEIGDPRTESSINLDDLRRLTDRVTLIETGSLYAQIPPSRTCRIVSNIETWVENQDTAIVRSNVVIWEHRRARTSAFVGWQQHKLVEQAGSWRIRHKVISLVNSEDPQGNITFIL